MSQNDDSINAQDPPEPGPSKMTQYAVATLALTSSLALAAVLFITFWSGRPVNLVPRTQELADLLELSLVDNYVPPENIVRSLPETQSLELGNTTTYWGLHTFRVSVPRRLNNEGLRDVLIRDMSDYNVHVMAGEADPRTPGADQLRFYLEDYQFAELSLLPGAEEVAAAYRSDLRNSSLQLADVTGDVLAALGPKAAPLREKALPREDLNSLWNYTRFTAALPEGFTVGALKEQLEAAITIADARVETGENLDGDVNVLITLGGRPCVGLACQLNPLPPRTPPDPVNLDNVLTTGIQGSEPDETMPEPSEPPMDATETQEVEATELPPVDMPEDQPKNGDTPAKAVTPPAPRDSTKPLVRMAIILDDGGHNKADADRVFALDNRLTLAILPNTPYGTETAEEGDRLGFEIMLHMPMETHSPSEEAVEGTIYTAMGKKEIQKLTIDAIEQYPQIAGINNHTGSKFTERADKLAFVYEVLKERDLFFIDSYTMNTSVAYESAREAGIPTARRDVFLDNSKDAESIRKQFDELVATAIKNGSAIGIGHFTKPNMAKVLAEEIPKLKNAGIELVHASELVQ